MEKEIKNTGDGQTPAQSVSTEDEKKPKDINPEIEEEKIEVSKTEYEKTLKKAHDFDGIIEKQRLANLSKKDKEQGSSVKQDGLTKEELIEAAKEAAREIASSTLQNANHATYEANLSTAYKKFVSENKWADSDDIIHKISEEFKKNDNGALSVDELYAQLDRAALSSYPTEYKKALEKKAEAKVLGQDMVISSGEGGGASGSAPASAEVVDTSSATAEDVRIANKFFNGDLARYMKQKNKSGV